MTISHEPSMDAREPADDDFETFEQLEPGDTIKFLEWPVEALSVIGWEEDDEYGEVVRVEVNDKESFIYEVDGNLWNYSPEYEGENNPFPVQNLVHVEEVEAETE
ncbi:hypothetical protein C5B90_13145 [Haloferax sp. Atlit-12N]|uniref:hypothetical protein n=1 Tax=Haloferax sp. Atlit-12N TaxID=2077203 RepID=UPI000E26BA80|nr:hypothetical protein [Haloferax sp. Atlit-12N]RDZ64042.1 hypothetical protein C5B90_13145 [Haloferax sp. Atlit-12N]